MFQYTTSRPTIALLILSLTHFPNRKKNYEPLINQEYIGNSIYFVKAFPSDSI